MNYVDSWGEFESKQGHHRRVRTSLSFREAPTFIELEDENFFILSFKNGVETGELGSKVKKPSVDFEELKQRKAERCRNKNNRGGNVPDKKNKENQEINKLASDEKPKRRINHKIGNNSKVKDPSDILRPTKNSNENSNAAMRVVKKSKPTNQEGKSDGGRSRRKKKKENVSIAKKVETECNSENSSPVSVLDPKVHTSEEDSRLSGSNLRRTLSAELETSSPCNTDSPTSDDQYQDMKINEGKCHGSRKKDYPNQNYVQMRSEICKMAGGEMMELNWIRDMGKVEGIEDIGTDFGLQILEQLLNELVDQLVTTSHSKF
ncbi:hypothetical protein F0562_001108 [Nyssa sinensis]|uniref:DUF3741 domain-containing protein n=1 Tax=Nyssa sinensis TaxID=561372 RepID=A0A5J5C2J6_9ASTE|nr:hypothetical protein F0562_001108 [Nyssa sinensis]